MRLLRIPEPHEPDQPHFINRGGFRYEPVDGPVYRRFLLPSDDGNGGPEVEEGYEAWLDINELVEKGWLVEVGEEQT